MDNSIEFRGAKAVILASCLYKQYMLLYGYRFISNEFYLKYKSFDTFEAFILANLKNQDTIKDLLNIVDFNESDIELICSFVKDNNEINYNKSSIAGLSPLKIKEIMKIVITSFVNQEIYFFNDKEKIDLKENLKECIKNGNSEVEFKDLVNI